MRVIMFLMLLVLLTTLGSPCALGTIASTITKNGNTVIGVSTKLPFRLGRLNQCFVVKGSLPNAIANKVVTEISKKI